MKGFGFLKGKGLGGGGWRLFWLFGSSFVFRGLGEVYGRFFGERSLII